LTPDDTVPEQCSKRC
jgi:hypothetical protein